LSNHGAIVGFVLGACAGVLRFLSGPSGKGQNKGLL